MRTKCDLRQKYDEHELVKFKPIVKVNELIVAGYVDRLLTIRLNVYNKPWLLLRNDAVQRAVNGDKN